MIVWYKIFLVEVYIDKFFNLVVLGDLSLVTFLFSLDDFELINLGREDIFLAIMYLSVSKI